MGEHRSVVFIKIIITYSFYLSRTRPNLLVETSLFRQVIQLFHWLNGTAKCCEVNLTACLFDF